MKNTKTKITDENRQQFIKAFNNLPLNLQETLAFDDYKQKFSGGDKDYKLTKEQAKECVEAVHQQKDIKWTPKSLSDETLQRAQLLNTVTQKDWTYVSVVSGYERIVESVIPKRSK